MLRGSPKTFQVWLARSQEPRIRRKSLVGGEFIVADRLAILVHDSQTVDAFGKAMKQHGFEPLFPCEEHPEFVLVTALHPSATPTATL